MFMTGLSCHCHRLVTMNGAQSTPTPSPIIMARAGATVDTVIAWLKIWMIGSGPITLASDRMGLVGAAALGSRLASRRRVGDAG